ncbi:hypothetical protein [Amycolatopsis tolypomycina]|uniref:hypothetical protein n=1 Tax=Amycolatopsis tolypomycina TaxID=208445 RepID=UPI00142DF01A|nr:hypothetical protein [Amycolatopsis tolypomycina]
MGNHQFEPLPPSRGLPRLAGHNDEVSIQPKVYLERLEPEIDVEAAHEQMPPMSTV